MTDDDRPVEILLVHLQDNSLQQGCSPVVPVTSPSPQCYQRQQNNLAK